MQRSYLSNLRLNQNSGLEERKEQVTETDTPNEVDSPSEIVEAAIQSPERQQTNVRSSLKTQSAAEQYRSGSKSRYLKKNSSANALQT